MSTDMFVHPENAPAPILITLEGIVTCVNATHSENAQSPMFVTLEGIVTFVNPWKSQNA